MSRTFDQVAAVYDQTRALPATVEAAIAEGILAQTQATTTTRFLEVGVGTGRIALPLVQRGYRYWGLDLSNPMLRAAQAKSPQLTLVRGNATQLPFREATIDVGLVIHLFHLIPDWPTALTEILRLIRPGGYFLYGSEQPATQHLPEPLAEQWRLILAQYGLQPRNHRATDQAVEIMLRERGYPLRSVVVATWSRQTTVAESLSYYSSRKFSASWTIPDPIFAAANANLATWAATQYPNLDSPMEHWTQFKILLATMPKRHRP